jgi:hypothetical protein
LIKTLDTSKNPKMFSQVNSKKVTDECNHKAGDGSPCDMVQNTDTSLYLNILKPKLDAISITTNIESTIDIDINAWQNFRNYPNGNVNLYYNDVHCPNIWAQQ